MIGSIIGDIVGSIYEFNNIKTKEFSLFSVDGEYADDSILTFATADWLLHGGDISHYYADYASSYPNPMVAMEQVLKEGCSCCTYGRLQTI